MEDFRRGASCWWRDICNLDKGAEWFSQVAIQVVGNGSSVNFWNDVWVGNQSLKVRFQRLFRVSVQQDHSVMEMGRWQDGVWSWKLEWRRNFFVREEPSLQQLSDLIMQANISDAADRWVWNPSRDDGFSVKSMYFALTDILQMNNQRPSLESFAFNYIWKSGVPSKVSALAWQLLLEKIPTRDNLSRRGVIRIVDALCPACAEVIESTPHLFLHCQFAAGVWYSLNRWLSFITVLPPDLFSSYAMLVGCGIDKKRRKGFSIVWLALVWALWKSRNERIFNNKEVGVTEVVEYIQLMSWKWYMNSVAKVPCLL